MNTAPPPPPMDDLKVTRILCAVMTCMEELKDSVSFVNLTDAVGEADSKGNFSMDSDKYENLSYWGGVSQEFAHVIFDLIDANVIKIRPCASLIYVVDGRMPRYPVARARKAYKTPHWLPVVFEPVESTPRRRV